MPGAYVPERGDLIWITLNPQAGHEQAGRRPALVRPASALRGFGITPTRADPFVVASGFRVPPRVQLTANGRGP